MQTIKKTKPNTWIIAFKKKRKLKDGKSKIKKQQQTQQITNEKYKSNDKDKTYKK